MQDSSRNPSHTSDRYRISHLDPVVVGCGCGGGAIKQLLLHILSFPYLALHVAPKYNGIYPASRRGRYWGLGNSEPILSGILFHDLEIIWQLDGYGAFTIGGGEGVSRPRLARCNTAWYRRQHTFVPFLGKGNKSKRKLIDHSLLMRDTYGVRT